MEKQNFEKGSDTSQNHSSSDSHHSKRSPTSKFSMSPIPQCYLKNPDSNYPVLRF